jgi:DNA-binding GntR family transcriptional regulator
MSRANLTVEVYNLLKQRIINWEYPPGYHLREDALRQEFNISRIPVREALRMLEEKNFVEKIPNKGCTVKQPNLEEIHHIYETRTVLEVHSVRQLASKGMASAIWQQLQDTWLTIQQELSDSPDLPEHLSREQIALLDQTFHETLAAATGNHFLHDMLMTINERLFFLRTMDITSPEKLLNTCQQHLIILDYIAAHNVDLAEKALRDNIDYGYSNVKEALYAALAKSFFRDK